MSLSFDSKVYRPVDRKHYQLYWRPDVWYNTVDGVKAGLHFNGNYFNYHHIFSATVWYNTGAGRMYTSNPPELINYRIHYRNAIDRNLFLFAETKILDGLIGNKAGLEKTSGTNRFGIYFKGMYRNNHRDSLTVHTHPRGVFDNDMRNNSLNIEAEHNYSYRRGNGKILLQLRSSALYNDSAGG